MSSQWAVGGGRWAKVSCPLFTVICLLLLTACTPQVQEMRPVADIKSEIPYRSWLPAQKPRAVIIALHGFNDYSNAFEYPGKFFKARGVAVYAYDQRGFGKTGQVGIWGGEENFKQDLSQFVSWLRTKYPHTPVYVLGESMGGAVAITALADADFPKVKGLILVSPALWGLDTMNPMYRSTLWFAAHAIPFREFTGSDLKIIACSNYPLLSQMYHDPLVIKKTRVDAVYGMLHLMDSAYTDVSKIHTPTLLLYGANDQVIPPYPIKGALHHFEQPVTFGYYPHGYHMLLRDLEREVVMRDILSWIKNPNAKLSSGYGKTIKPEDNAAVEAVIN